MTLDVDLEDVALYGNGLEDSDSERDDVDEARAHYEPVSYVPVVRKFHVADCLLGKVNFASIKLYPLVLNTLDPESIEMR